MNTGSDPARTELESELALPSRAYGRRAFLALGGLTVVGVMTGAAAWLSDESSKVAKAVPGLNRLPLPLQRFTIYTVTDGYPEKRAADWSLRIGGLVERPTTIDFAGLQQRKVANLTRDFQCVTGWRVPDVKWRGVLLRDLLDEAGVGPKAKAIRLFSFDGEYTESLTLEQARRDDVIVAYEMEGAPITREHGGPVRLYVAPMYGYKSLKWLDRIEVVDHVTPGYWEVRGYDIDAWVGSSNGRNDDSI